MDKDIILYIAENEKQPEPMRVRYDGVKYYLVENFSKFTNSWICQAEWTNKFNAIRDCLTWYLLDRPSCNYQRE